MKTATLLDRGAGRGPARPWRSRRRVPGLRGPTLMLPVCLDDPSPGKGLGFRDLKPEARWPSWEDSRAGPSGEGYRSHPLSAPQPPVPSGPPGELKPPLLGLQALMGRRRPLDVVGCSRHWNLLPLNQLVPHPKSSAVTTATMVSWSPAWGPGDQPASGTPRSPGAP